MILSLLMSFWSFSVFFFFLQQEAVIDMPVLTGEDLHSAVLVKKK